MPKHLQTSGAALLLAMIGIAAPMHTATARCMPEPQGDGHVAAIIDGHTFRLADGAEVRLAGVVLARDDSRATDALAALIADRDVALFADSDSPDRYGRQAAIVYRASDDRSVQEQLLAQGALLMSGTMTDAGCAAELAAAEAAARREKRGIWFKSGVIKNTESPGDILADVGRFTLVEGRVLSVRQAGATTYLNFGRRWTEDFAVTVSRRMMTAFEAAGITLKSLERRRIRVRGWVERHGGPRIEVVRVGQIEVVGDN